jgi:hypothetical protein
LHDDCGAEAPQNMDAAPARAMGRAAAVCGASEPPGEDMSCCGDAKPRSIVAARREIAKIAKPTGSNYERSRGIWTNLFGGSKKNSEENSEK